VIRIVLLGILLMIAAWAFWRMVDGIIAGFGGQPGRTGRGPTAMKLARDPVCGTWVARREALSKTTGGTTHYFCSEECRTRYHGRT
jgi:YHS domain-containing protein